MTTRHIFTSLVSAKLTGRDWFAILAGALILGLLLVARFNSLTLASMALFMMPDRKGENGSLRPPVSFRPQIDSKPFTNNQLFIIQHRTASDQAKPTI